MSCRTVDFFNRWMDGPTDLMSTASRNDAAARTDIPGHSSRFRPSFHSQLNRLAVANHAVNGVSDEPANRDLVLIRERPKQLILLARDRGGHTRPLSSCRLSSHRDSPCSKVMHCDSQVNASTRRRRPRFEPYGKAEWGLPLGEVPLRSLAV